MSFQEQERALFDLLFDKKLRDDFCRLSIEALTAYDLSNSEREDFKTVRPDALRVDANVRNFLILTALFKYLPLTFAIVSSMENGIETLRTLIDSKTMRVLPEQRPLHYAERLRAWVKLNEDYIPANILQNFYTVFDAELNMARTGVSLKLSLNKVKKNQNNTEQLNEHWLQQPLTVTHYVTTAMLPRPYKQIKKILFPSTEQMQWGYLCKNPILESTRNNALTNQKPRFFIAQAKSACPEEYNASISHQTIEFSGQFGMLFDYIDGTHSLTHILELLSSAGAKQKDLTIVSSNFKKMMAFGMLSYSH